MDKKRKILVGALVLGLISGPALALGIGGLVGGEAAVEPVVASTTIPIAAGVAPDPAPATDAAADLLAACGAEGRALAAGEAAGALSDVEQAALDALRPICAENGLPLPEAIGAAEDIVVVETVFVGGSGDETRDAAGFDDQDDEYEDEEDGEREEDEADEIREHDEEDEEDEEDDDHDGEDS